MNIHSSIPTFSSRCLLCVAVVNWSPVASTTSCQYTRTPAYPLARQANVSTTLCFFSCHQDRAGVCCYVQLNRTLSQGPYISPVWLWSAYFVPCNIHACKPYRGAEARRTQHTLCHTSVAALETSASWSAGTTNRDGCLGITVIDHTPKNLGRACYTHMHSPHVRQQ